MPIDDIEARTRSELLSYFDRILSASVTCVDATFRFECTQAQVWLSILM